MDIVVWLRSLGLGKYEAAFRENDIDETVCKSCEQLHSIQVCGCVVSPNAARSTRGARLPLHPTRARRGHAVPECCDAKARHFTAAGATRPGCSVNDCYNVGGIAWMLPRSPRSSKSRVTSSTN